MPQLQSISNLFAINAADDVSPSGVVDTVTGQPIYGVTDMQLGVYFDCTNAEAASMSDTAIGLLYAGRYRRVKVDSGATAANVKTGTIGLMPSLAAINIAIGGAVGGVASPNENVVTSYDQGAAAGLRPVVFLNSITPGNSGWIQELGIATVLGGASLQKSPVIGDLINSAATGVVDDPSAQTMGPLFLGKAIDLPKVNVLFRVQLGLPVVQE